MTEPVTVIFNIAELAAGTYVYLDANDEVLAIGALADDEFPGDDDDDTTVADMPRLFPRDGLSDRTFLGSPMAPRAPAPRPDFGSDDDDDPLNHTIIGPQMAPRVPAPKRK